MTGLIFNFLMKLFTGEVFRVWAAHKDKEKQKDIANAPITQQEQADYFK